MARRKHTLPLSSLSPEQQAAVREQLASQVRAPDPEPAPPAPVRSAHTGKGAKKGMSRLEQRFAAWLDQQQNQGLVHGYAYELANVRLGVPRASKRPDFWLRCDPSLYLNHDDHDDHPIVVVEVKPKDGGTGKPYFGPKGRLSVKLAAQRLALIHVPLYVAWPHEDDWRFERVEVRA